MSEVENSILRINVHGIISLQYFVPIVTMLVVKIKDRSLLHKVQGHRE